MKRTLLVLLVLGLAGCTLPGDEDAEPQLFGSCPQWIAAQEGVEQGDAVNGSANLMISANETYQDRPLDMYLLEITSDGAVRVEAYLPNGARAAFHEVEDDRLLTPPFLNVDGTKEARVFLTPVEHGAASAPGPIRLALEGSARVDVVATPFYRVCGVLVD